MPTQLLFHFRGLSMRCSTSLLSVNAIGTCSRFQTPVSPNTKVLAEGSTTAAGSPKLPELCEWLRTSWSPGKARGRTFFLPTLPWDLFGFRRRIPVFCRQGHIWTSSLTSPGQFVAAPKPILTYCDLARGAADLTQHNTEANLERRRVQAAAEVARHKSLTSPLRARLSHAASEATRKWQPIQQNSLTYSIYGAPASQKARTS